MFNLARKKRDEIKLTPAPAQQSYTYSQYSVYFLSRSQFLSLSLTQLILTAISLQYFVFLNSLYWFKVISVRCEIVFVTRSTSVEFG